MIRRLVLIIFTCLISVLNSQNTATPTTFMDRYYLIKGSYEKLEEAFGPFANCNYSLDDFMKRYYAFKDAYRALPRYEAQYAASEHSLSEFEKKYYEIKKVYPELY